MKKVNIGFFGTRGLGNYGGFETIAKKLDWNLDINFFNFFVSKEVEQGCGYVVEKENLKTNLILQSKTALKKYSKELDNIINEGRILRKLKKNNVWDIDVIFQCGSTPGLVMGKLKKNSSSPLIFWNPDGLEWKRAKFSRWAQLILYYSTVQGIKNSHAITVDSKNIAIDLKRIIKGKPTYYLPSGADIITEDQVSIKYLEEYNLRREQYYILVARAVPENHILEILRYFREINSTKKLVVICNFDEGNYSKICLKEIKQSKNIIYKGPIYNNEKLSSLRYYSYAYIHGHSVGGTNPSLLEALGSGSVCVCYDVIYNREVAQDAAKYFKNLEEFKKSINNLESDDIQHRQMKEKARTIIKENFNWDYITELHEAITMRNLLEHNKIEKNDFEEWLNAKLYKVKLINEKFGRIN